MIVVWCHWQALGGLIVGLVTKYAGGVKKGFALIAGTSYCLIWSMLLVESKDLLMSNVVQGFVSRRSCRGC